MTLIPKHSETRRGIPQANHVHGLLLRGRQVLEELFPGLQDEMIAAGAPVVDMANEIAWFTRAGWGVRFPSELKVLAFTRPLLDLHVRRRLAQNPKVEIMDNTDVLRLIPGRDEESTCRRARFARAARMRIAESLKSCEPIWLLTQLVARRARRAGSTISVTRHLKRSSSMRISVTRAGCIAFRRTSMRDWKCALRAVCATGAKARRDPVQG